MQARIFLYFNEFLAESSNKALKSTKAKKQKAAKRMNNLFDRSAKNELKFKYFDDKEKYEKIKLGIDRQIESADDSITKLKLRDKLTKLKSEWKTTKAKYKEQLKHMN